MITPPLQPGQYWRTRSGSIVYVASILPEWVNDTLPVLGISKGLHVECEQNWYRLDGGFFETGDSDEDLITHLPDCGSLDWVPIEYPKYYHGSGIDSGYFRRDSKTRFVWVNESGEESVQCGNPDILLEAAFTEIPREEFDAESRVKKSEAPLESTDDWVPQESVPARIVDEYRWSNWPSGEWRSVTQSMERQGVSSGARSLFMRGVTLSVRCHRKDHPSQQKPPSHHTAPYVYSLIGEASKHNDYHSFENASVSIGCLIRICSAQQSMLSELSAQVDTLRSEITSGGEKCQKE